LEEPKKNNNLLNDLDDLIGDIEVPAPKKENTNKGN
jgi:hypothetical protein